MMSGRIKGICIYPGCTHTQRSMGAQKKAHKQPTFSVWCNYHRSGKGKPERLAYRKKMADDAAIQEMEGK